MAPPALATASSAHRANATARTAQMQPARRGPRIASRATTAQRSAPRKCNQRATLKPVW